VEKVIFVAMESANRINVDGLGELEQSLNGVSQFF
jgi:hypothetical protein